jgi:hypothetical protein
MFGGDDSEKHESPVVRWLGLLLATLLPATSSPSAESRLGAAAVPVNPPLGIALAGYYHERASEGLLDDIFAKATVLDDDQTRAAIVVCVAPFDAPLPLRKAPYGISRAKPFG